MRLAIGEFLEECEEDELALVHASGHGVRLAGDGGEFHSSPETPTSAGGPRPA